MGRPRKEDSAHNLTYTENKTNFCDKAIDIPCVVCYINDKGFCRIKNKHVPKLKASAIEWPKEMMQ